MLQKLMDLMAVASSVVPLGLLHMWPLQHWLKARIPPWVWCEGHLMTVVAYSSSAPSGHPPNQGGQMLGLICGYTLTESAVVPWDSSAAKPTSPQHGSFLGPVYCPEDTLWPSVCATCNGQPSASLAKAHPTAGSGISQVN